MVSWRLLHPAVLHYSLNPIAVDWVAASVCLGRAAVGPVAADTDVGPIVLAIVRAPLDRAVVDCCSTAGGPAVVDIVLDIDPDCFANHHRLAAVVRTVNKAGDPL